MNTFHCFFEQSGTFKNEFLKLGFNAFDYDILNDFGETDFVIDLFKEINKCFTGEESIFDRIDSNNDTVIAFFPCTRFDNQILLWFLGNVSQLRYKSEKEKLLKCLDLHDKLHEMYKLVTKLVLICIERNIKLIIENPFSTQHYLSRYWPIKPKIIDYNRRQTGDYFKKPTQYWFINCEPSNNFIFEPVDIKKKKLITNISNKAERSMISSDYANRFIREFILKEDINV